MSRIRTIKPEFFLDDDLAELSPLARLLFIGLWTIADCEGRLEDRQKRIRAQIHPYDDGDTDAMLQTLHDGGFIQRYKVGDKRFIQVTSFKKHQRLSGKESDETSQIPEPPENNGEAMVKQSGSDGEAMVKQSGSNGEAMVKQSGSNGEAVNVQEGNGKEGKGNGKEGSTRAHSARKTTLPPGLQITERIRQWAAQHGYDRLEEHLENFKLKAASKGYQYVDWESALMAAIRDDWAKLRQAEPRQSQAKPRQSQDEPTDEWSQITHDIRAGKRSVIIEGECHAEH